MNMLKKIRARRRHRRLDAGGTCTPAQSSDKQLTILDLGAAD